MSKKAICIDPGPKTSGVVIYDGSIVEQSSKDSDNKWLADSVLPFCKFDILIIEMISSYGMPVGKDTFETCVWIGEFRKAFGREKTKLIYRRDVKLHLCNSARAKDKNIRQAVLDRFDPTGAGATPQIGTKNKPGPLYGISGHAISALALGITYFETLKTRGDF